MKGNSIHDFAALTDYKKDALALRERCALDMPQPYCMPLALHIMRCSCPCCMQAFACIAPGSQHADS